MEFALPEYTRFKDNTKLDHIPCSYGLPLIGDTFQFVLKPFEVLDAHYQKYGPVFKASLTFQKFVVALGPEFMQQLMLDSKQTFSARMGYNTPLGDFFAGGGIDGGERLERTVPVEVKQIGVHSYSSHLPRRKDQPTCVPGALVGL